MLLDHFMVTKPPQFNTATIVLSGPFTDPNIMVEPF
jgi:hypothetical protein